MAIKRYYAEADNTITNAYDTSLSKRGTGSNAGANDVLEAFSIYGQYSTSSSELSRILIKFPVTGTTSIEADRDASLLPAAAASGLKFYLKLFNARHDEQLPENLTLSIFPVSRDWEEGTGIDLVERKDTTEDTIPGSNWDNRTKAVAWTRNGGDYLSGSTYATSSFTASFVTGSEDLEVDVTALVEDWISTNVVATGSVTISSVAQINNGDKVTLVAADGTSHDFTAGDVAGGGTWIAEVNNNTSATNLATQINANAKFSAPAPGAAIVTIYQATAGTPGNTTIVLTDSGAPGMTKVDFDNGTGLDNYGFGIMVTSSQEAYVTAADSGSELQNTGGITKSMYTKRFFARSSEFFFRRPVIEARWTSRKTDDRNKFYASSSLCSTANTQSLYLYNYVDGQLTSVGETVKCAVYASTASAPTGDALVTDASASMVETGIYQAQVVVNTTASTLHDVWSQADGGGDYHTGSITVRTRAAQTANTQSQYVTTITNLKDSYSRKNTSERFRVFARARNFTPTVYTVANKNIEGETIISASYSIFRTVDGKVLFPHSTGSTTLHTYLSYDTSGSYFDFDISLLESGYMYGVQLAYFTAGAWKEQEEIFKFRVED